MKLTSITQTTDTDSETINAKLSFSDYEAGVSISQDSNVSEIGDTNRYKATITNNGQQQIATATLSVVTGNGIHSSNAIVIARCRPLSTANQRLWPLQLLQHKAEGLTYPYN